MAFQKTTIVGHHQYRTLKSEIHPEYVFTCTKHWKDENHIQIYRADREGVFKIFEDRQPPCPKKHLAIAGDIISQALTDNVLVAGAHTVINLKDRFLVSDEVLDSADFSLGLIAMLHEQRRKQADLLIPLNDFYMERDEDETNGDSNVYRHEALNPYVLPPRINDLIISYSTRLDRPIGVYYCSEKNMADRFKRHIKNAKKIRHELFSRNNGNWNISAGPERIPVIVNDKPNCVAGNAATLRSVRHVVRSNKIRDNYTSHVGVYPLCSVDNVLNGYKAARAFYDLDLPAFFIFFGRSCY